MWVQYNSTAEAPLSYTANVVTQTAATVLIVNGQDEGENYSYFMEPIDALMDDWVVSYGTWDKLEREMNYGDLVDSGIKLVIWTTGNDGFFSPYDGNGLNQFVADGGNLMLSGDDVAVAISATSFITSQLGYTPFTIQDEDTIYGVEDDLIGNGFVLQRNGGDGANNSTSPWALAPSEDATPFLRYNENRVAGVRYETDTGRKAIVLGFPFEAIADSADRFELMERILLWVAEPDVNDVAEAGSNNLPLEFVVEPVYPNPFNNQTNISFQFPKSGDVTVQVFDVLGRSIATLVSSTLQAGYHQTNWNGHEVASGLYFVEVRYQNRSQLQKMMLMK